MAIEKSLLLINTELACHPTVTVESLLLDVGLQWRTNECNCVRKQCTNRKMVDPVGLIVLQMVVNEKVVHEVVRTRESFY